MSSGNSSTIEPTDAPNPTIFTNTLASARSKTPEPTVLPTQTPTPRLMTNPTSGITYEWKVDIAIVISIINFFIMLFLRIFDNLRKKKEKKINAYETVYDDACYLMAYPHRRRKKELAQYEYTHENPDIQNAVRKYIESHWMEYTWGIERLVPDSIKTENEQQIFIKKVRQEAREFQDHIFELQIKFNLAELSPVYYLDDDEIVNRMSNILQYVGKNLSLFSQRIRSCWEEAKFKDPAEVKLEYERAIKVCPHYFKHNPRDFNDPFFDIVSSIRIEYRSMTRSKTKKFQRNILSFWRKTLRPIRKFKYKK